MEDKQSDLEQAIRHRHHLHQHPEIGLETKETAAYIKDVLGRLGLPVQDIGSHSVLALVEGLQQGPTTLLRADTDALPITEANTFPHCSKKAGLMHACGHDGHTASLLLTAARLAQHPPRKGRVALLFQSGEEGHGGAQRVIEDGLFQRFPIDRVFGFHNRPGLSVGCAEVYRGYCMAARAHWSIRLKGKGSHAARPHLGVEPFAAVADLINGLQKIVPRCVNTQSPAVFSITQVHGGTASNVIPEQAWLQGTARSFTPETGDILERSAQALVDGIAQSYGIQAQLEYRRTLPALRNTLPQAMLKAAQLVFGPDKVFLDHPPTMGSEDFTLYLQHRPGGYIFIGNGENSGALHTPQYDFNDEVIPLAAQWFLAIVAQHAEQQEENENFSAALTE